MITFVPVEQSTISMMSAGLAATSFRSRNVRGTPLCRISKPLLSIGEATQFRCRQKRSPGRRRGCARAWPVECFLGKWCRPSLSYIFKHSRKAPARLYFPGGRPFRIDAASFASIFHEKQLARLGDPTHVRGGALTDGEAGMQLPSTTLRDLSNWLVISGQRTALHKARHNQSQPLRW